MTAMPMALLIGQKMPSSFQKTDQAATVSVPSMLMAFWT